MRSLIGTAGFACFFFGAELVAQPSATASGTMQELALRAQAIAGVITSADTAAIIDRPMRLIDVAGEYNVGVAVVLRRPVNGVAPPDALRHSAITEIYYVLEGRGVMVTGGAIEGPRTLAPDGVIVRQLVGPSERGTGIRGGEARMLGPGDVIVVPPNTPHGFSHLDTPEVRYLVFRIDPRRVLELPEAR